MIRRAFTLIELIATLVVLAILVGVVMPTYVEYRDEARLSAAKSARAAMVTAIKGAKLESAMLSGGEGDWPADLELVMYTQQGSEDFNPYRLPSQGVYEIDAAGGASRWHASDKTIEEAAGGGRGAIWYNPANGALEFRVPEQLTPALTIALYNDVNQCNITSLTQTTP